MAALSVLLLVLLPLQDLRDLDSPDSTVARCAIEAAIRAADEKALEAAAKTSRGARFALSEVRAHKRFGEAYPQALTITYEAKDRPAGEVISKLSALLGRRIELGELAAAQKESALSISLRDATFLEAVEALESSLGGEFRIRRDALQYSGFAATPTELHYYWRHFKIALGRFRESRPVMGVGDLRPTIRLVFDVWADGRCRFVGDRQARLIEVVDDTGKTYAPGKDDEEASYGPWHEYQQFGSWVDLAAPPPEAKKLSIVRGVWRFLLPEEARIEELALTDLDRKVESLNLSMRVVEASADGAVVKVEGEVADREKAHVRPIPDDFHLAGKDGRVVPAEGTSAGSAESISLNLKFTLPERFEATALKIRVFRKVGEHEFPFEFKDIPLR